MKKRRIIIKKKIICFSIFIILCLVAFAGCGEDTESDLTNIKNVENEKELIKVGFSQLGSESVWRVANTESIRNSLTKERGFLLEYNNARQKQENQIKAIRGFIAENVDYIVFSPVTEEGWDTVLKEANAAGIPVILADRKIRTGNKNLYKTWVGSDARSEGERAAKWLEDYLTQKRRESENINIVVLQGTTGSSVQLGRTMGFDIISDTHENWHILEQASGDFTAAKGKEVMLSFLDKYDDIDVIVSQNDDMTFGALDAMDERGVSYGISGDVIVISFDAVHEALEKVQNGDINVDIECNPEEGEYIVGVINRLQQGKSVEKTYIVDEQIFTIDNVDDYIDNRSY